MAALAAERGLVLQVGHLLRYSAEHQAISMRMRRPLYLDCIRVAPFKTRGTDVSVILDLMIHDLDLVLALVDSPIASVDAVGAPVASTHEDIANARVRFENGCVATITASRISLKTERKMRLFSQEGYMSVDFGARKLMMIGRERGLPIPGTGGGRIEEITWKEHDALEAEHAAFAAAVLDGAEIVVGAQAGRRALEAALSVADSMAASRARAEASGLIRIAL
jgi:predicted dehydrogenase